MHMDSRSVVSDCLRFPSLTYTQVTFLIPHELKINSNVFTYTWKTTLTSTSSKGCIMEVQRYKYVSSLNHSFLTDHQIHLVLPLAQF